MGGEDAAPAGRSHPPEPPPAGGGRGPGDGGPGAQDRRLPRAGRVRPAGSPLRPLRGGGPQRPGELRAVRGPRRHHRQQRRLRAARALTEEALARHRAADRVAGRAGRAARHARRPAAGPRLLLPRPGAAGRPGHHRLHRVRRALPLRRPGVRHGLPGHGAQSPGSPGSGRGRSRRRTSWPRATARAAALLPFYTCLPGGRAGQGGRAEVGAGRRSRRPTGRWP